MIYAGCIPVIIIQVCLLQHMCCWDLTSTKLCSYLQDKVHVGARVSYLKSRGKEAFAKKDYHAALYFFGRVCSEGSERKCGDFSYCCSHNIVFYRLFIILADVLFEISIYRSIAVSCRNVNRTEHLAQTLLNSRLLVNCDFPIPENMLMKGSYET